MSKKAKVWIIIGSVLQTLLLAYFSLIIVGTIKTLWNRYDFKNTIKKYGLESNLVYADYKDIYYHNQKYDFKYEILWLDDTFIIYQDESKYYIKDSENTNELLLNDIERITYGSLFVRENNIYFKSKGNNYVYNINDNSLLIISKNEYLEKRDGNKYSFDISLDDGEMNISITDNENNQTKVINSKKLLKIKCVKYIDFEYYGRLFNYYVWGDQIYLFMYGDAYSIILIYEFENDKLEVYDWFYRETSRTCYLAFKINNKDNNPVLEDLIKS